jgi:uncharacterized coiled-coil DUF342 family protein
VKEAKEEQTGADKQTFTNLAGEINDLRVANRKIDNRVETLNNQMRQIEEEDAVY